MRLEWTGDRRHVTSLEIPCWFSCRCVAVDIGRLQFSYLVYTNLCCPWITLELTTTTPSRRHQIRLIRECEWNWFWQHRQHVCVCVCVLCSISWWCWNHISLHHRRSKSLEGNFRFSTEDNILLMSAVNIQAHGTQNDKIKIMWIRLRPQVGILYYERNTNVYACDTHISCEIAVYNLRANVCVLCVCVCRQWSGRERIARVIKIVSHFKHISIGTFPLPNANIFTNNLIYAVIYHRLPWRSDFGKEHSADILVDC